MLLHYVQGFTDPQITVDIWIKYCAYVIFLLYILRRAISFAEPDGAIARSYISLGLLKEPSEKNTIAFISIADHHCFVGR